MPKIGIHGNHSKCFYRLSQTYTCYIHRAHNVFARWQDIQFKSLLVTISKDDVVLVIDFVENYGFKVQNEVLVYALAHYSCQHFGPHHI